MIISQYIDIHTVYTYINSVFYLFEQVSTMQTRNIAIKKSASTLQTQNAVWGKFIECGMVEGEAHTRNRRSLQAVALIEKM